ncbi:MAG: asparagine synthase (glutamine-hydrolyzing), partial [Candidatus Omnitrophica bacterium]|nr:asparagine synthase (glutamine-hydrolyzing) [Candidatus Omnitrophota bacterium]
MCGLCGIVSYGVGSAPEDQVRRMADKLVHRGPDEAGYHSSAALGGDSVRCTLGHRRLQIIDIEGGHQPLSNADESTWVVFNGEIYNFRELRAELERKGHKFRTCSDTEVLVHAYDEHGDEFLQYLRGMFAFCLWDRRRGRVLLARDRLGQKPMIYCCQKGQLFFASEFAALLEGLPQRPEPNLSALQYYFSYLYVPAPMSAYKGVQKLPPAHYLVWEKGQASLHQYWRADFSETSDIGMEEAGERLDELLEEAVRLRMISDVPLGAFLSGGIDSSLVVGLMSRSSERVRTFSIGFEESDFSELPVARAVAQHFGTEHHEEIVRPDALAILPELVAHYGEPYADSSAIPTYYVSKMTRKHVTVALTGDGGD